jgi:N-acetylglucosamine kinase-like BadF-type ATPase
MSKTQPMLLGMDGGGTVTTTWLADAEGRVLGQGHSGPTNIKAVGATSARTELDLSIFSAFRNAEIEPCPIEVSCLGLAGFDRPEDREWLTNWATGSVWAKHLILVSDGDLVVAAGTPEGWGVGVIAGTGSIAVGRGRAGEKARSGGWGHIFGDEGSGYAIAVAALKRIARFHDGRDPRGASGKDPLTRQICNHLSIPGPQSLIASIYNGKFDRAKIAMMAVEVLAAEAEDPSIFHEILEPAGVELAKMVQAVARKIGVAEGHLPLAMAGSFLLASTSLSKVLMNRLSEAGYQVQATPVTNPVEGALALARQGLESR